MSKLEKLIEDGYSVFEMNKKPALYDGFYASGAEYEEWIARVIFFIEDNKESIPEFLSNRVVEAANKAVGNGAEHFDRIVGILKSLTERNEFQEA